MITTQNLLTNKAFDIEFNGYLSNHAKHAIVALDKLEAPEARIQEYWGEYTKATPYGLSLHPVDKPWDSVQPCTPEEWCKLRGKKESWQEMCMFMNQELESNFDGDMDKLVRAYATPALLSGIPGALTHGIIHLGWGIDARNSWMTVEGLAYLNFCHIGLDPTKLTDNAIQETSPMESLKRIAKEFHSNNLLETWVIPTKAKYDKSFHPELVAAGFQWELAKILHEPHEIATQSPSWLKEMPLPELWRTMYETVVSLYLATRDKEGNGNFVVLHLITSLWGLERVCDLLEDEQTTRVALQNFFAMAVCIFSVSSGGFPTAEALQSSQDMFPIDKKDGETLNWTPIVERGCAEEEEHNIKLVYVSKELWNRYGRWCGFSEAARTFTLTPKIGPSATSFSA